MLRKHEVQDGKKDLFEAIHLQWKDLNTANYLFSSFPYDHPFVSAKFMVHKNIKEKLSLQISILAWRKMVIAPIFVTWLRESGFVRVPVTIN